MTHPTPDSQMTAPKLDAKTEQAINDFGGAQYSLGTHDRPSSDDEGPTSYDIKYARDTRNALRSRIRELVEEARKGAVKEGVESSWYARQSGDPR